MIKLIATDLDGTLLLPGGILPQEIFKIIDSLYARGTIFAVASGRQYESLKRLFAPAADKVLFIAENGALVIYKDKLLFSDFLPKNRLADIFAAIQSERNAYPLLCCADYAYAKDDFAPFLEECTKYYPHFKKINSRTPVQEKNSVCKVAVFDPHGAAENSGKNLAKKLPDLRVIVSGNVWSDISMPETNKGNALLFVQKYFHLQKEECAAFGDYMNDLEMLLVCGQSFVPENGFPVLKERIKNVIPSNAENGVVQKIRELTKI